MAGPGTWLGQPVLSDAHGAANEVETGWTKTNTGYHIKWLSTGLIVTWRQVHAGIMAVQNTYIYIAARCYGLSWLGPTALMTPDKAPKDGTYESRGLR